LLTQGGANLRFAAVGSALGYDIFPFQGIAECLRCFSEPLNSWCPWPFLLYVLFDLFTRPLCRLPVLAKAFLFFQIGALDSPAESDVLALLSES